MSEHTRFHIDLTPDDAAKLVKLTAHLTMKRGEVVTRPAVMRDGLRLLFKREKL